MASQFTAGRFQYLADDGSFAVGYRLYTYESGTTTHKNVYTTAALNVAATYTPDGSGGQYIALNSRGEAQIWLAEDGPYTFVVKTASGVTVETTDNVSAAEDAGAVAALITRLASLVSASDGAGMSGFTGSLNYAASTIGWAVKGIALNVKWFGVVGGGTTDNTAALNALHALLPQGGKLIFPADSGGYRVGTSAAVNLIDNLEWEFHGNAKLVQAPGVTNQYILRGNGCTNVRFRGMEIEGNGLAGLSAVYLTNCTDVTFDTCKITKAGAMALLHDGSTKLTVFNCNFSSNYYYGVDERNGARCKYTMSQFVSNGATGVATSTGGRGINVWKSNGTKVVGCDFISNNEYGFRLYSEVADATAENVDSIISSCNFKDNAAADIVVYNESGNVRRHIISDINVTRTTNTTIGGSVIVQGAQIRVSEVHVTKTGTMGTEAAFILFEADNCSLRGCSGKNFTEAIGFGTSTNCDIDGFVGDTVARVGIPLGSGIRLTNSRFTHGGAGTTDVGIQNYDATGRNFYENVTLDGFDVGIYTAGEDVDLHRMTTLNSTTAGWRVTGGDISGVETTGCDWGSTSPTILLGMERRRNGNATVYGNTQPLSLNWRMGDRWIDTVGGTAGLRCTVAGTPGTWA